MAVSISAAISPTSSTVVLVGASLRQSFQDCLPSLAFTPSGARSRIFSRSASVWSVTVTANVGAASPMAARQNQLVKRGGRRILALDVW